MSVPSRREIAQALIGLSQNTSKSRLAQTVAAYLVQHQRSGDLDAIMREVTRLREQQDDIVEATATTAFPINESLKKSIKNILQSNKLIINEVIDPEVLGGVRLETSEIELDLTVRNRLNELKAATR